MAAHIVKAERVSHPPLRFIGKRYNDYPDWGDWWANNWFGVIEQIGPRAEINDSSYCVLVGETEAGLEFYLGEFFPEGTPVPEGFDYADLPEMTAGLIYVHGKVDEIYNFVVSENFPTFKPYFDRLGLDMPKPKTRRWLSFERDNCPRFTDEDEDGCVILDYALYTDPLPE